MNVYFNARYLMLVILLWNHATSQSLKISVNAGGSTSSKPYSYQTFYGPITERGQYVFGTNASYPLFGNGVGIFFETTNKVMNKSDVSFKSNNIVTGISWRNEFTSVELELLMGFGYSWEKYKLTYLRYGSFEIYNELSIFHGGMALSIPVNDFLDIVFAGRATINNHPHVKTNFYIVNNDLYIPPVLYSGMIGLGFNLFRTD